MRRGQSGPPSQRCVSSSENQGSTRAKLLSFKVSKFEVIHECPRRQVRATTRLHWPSAVRPPCGPREGATMSDNTGDTANGTGLVLTPPARNYSPWYQWMVRLAATTHEDPLPEGDPAAIPAWLEAPARPAARAPRPRAHACSAERRDTRVRRMRRVPAGQDRVRHRGHHVGAGVSARPALARSTPHPVRLSWPATGMARASPKSSGWSTPTCPTPTTRCSWLVTATSSSHPICAASVSAWTGTPTTTTPATPTWSTPPWRAGTRWLRTSGTCGAPSMSCPSTRSSTRPASAWSASPTAGQSRSSRPQSTRVSPRAS